MDFKREQLGDVLRELLGKRNLRWVIRGAGIVILQDSKPATQIERFSATDSIPKITVIKGTVTADEGFPLAGATVKIEGTSVGTIADSKGRFLLSSTQDRSVISISYTGYDIQYFNVKGSETLVVKLKRANSTLDEQVVIAYGTSSRRKLTGSVGRVTAAEIEKQPIANPLAALQGRVPGLTVTQQSGIPGGNFAIQIRGQNSLRNDILQNGNNPLFIVDGVPFTSTNLDILSVSGTSLYPNSPAPGASPFNTINPYDIESIEILKDADATAIFGSRGANGVILITTKKGKEGALDIDLNFYTGFGEVTKRIPLLDTQQYLEMRNEAFANDGATPGPTDYDVNGAWDKTRYTDWQEELIGGTAKTTDAQLSINGGTKNVQYRFGGGFHKETTVFPGDFSDKRITSHFNLNSTSPNQKLRNSVSIGYSYGATNLLVRDLTQEALRLPPNAPSLFDEVGNLNYEKGTFAQNPLSYTKRPYDAKTNNLIGNVSLSYELIKGLTIRSSFGYTNLNRKEISKSPKSSFPPTSTEVNRSIFGRSEISSYIVEPQIEFRKMIGQSTINLLVGSTFQSESVEQISQSAFGFLTESLMDNISAVPSENVSSNYTSSEYKYAAIFARVNYQYKSKYLLNLTGRRDGSSRFGPGNQFGNFGAAGIGWIFSMEPFLSNASSFISFGKVRASYGVTGNDQIGNYQFLDTYTTTGGGQYQGIVALNPKQLYNEDFRWEKKRGVEAAIELGFFRDQLLMTIAGFSNRSSNQLVGYPLPPTTGFTSIQSNLSATIENKGFEFDIDATLFKRNNFSWKSSLNFTLPRNKLVSYPNIEGSSYASVYVVGKPLSIRQLYRFVEVNTETGLYEVKDVNQDNSYNLTDQVIAQNIGSRLFGGLQNSIRLFDIQLDFLLQYVQQNASNYLFNFLMPGLMINQPVDVRNRWKAKGEVSNVQKFTRLNNEKYARMQSSDASVSDASFLRLKNVSISYQIPDRLARHARMKSARLYILGQNIFTITKYRGMDPETQGNRLPPLRILTAGIQVKI